MNWVGVFGSWHLAGGLGRTAEMLVLLYGSRDTVQDIGVMVSPKERALGRHRDEDNLRGGHRVSLWILRFC